VISIQCLQFYIVLCCCQANQSLFWSYYYSALAVVILLLLIKSTPRHLEDNFDSFQVLTCDIFGLFSGYFIRACSLSTQSNVNLSIYYELQNSWLFSMLWVIWMFNFCYCASHTDSVYCGITVTGMQSHVTVVGWAATYHAISSLNLRDVFHYGHFQTQPRDTKYDVRNSKYYLFKFDADIHQLLNYSITVINYWII